MKQRKANDQPSTETDPAIDAAPVAEVKIEPDVIVSADVATVKRPDPDVIVSSDMLPLVPTAEKGVKTKKKPARAKKKTPEDGAKPSATENAFGRIIKFLFVGTFTGLLALGSFTLFIYIYDSVWNLPEYRTYAIFASEYLSVLFSCCLSFLLNSKFTFSDRKARRAGLVLYILYYIVATGLGSLLIIGLNNKGLDLTLAKLVKMTLNLICDFLFSRFFIFHYLKTKYKVSEDELVEKPLPPREQ